MSAKTEAAIVRAAMRWWKEFENYHYPRMWGRAYETRLAKACHAHAKATRRKRK